MKALDFLFTRRCEHCGALLGPGDSQCICSVDQDERIGAAFCEHCGHAIDGCVCDRPGSIQLRHITAPFVYRSYVRQRLLDYKIGNDRSIVGPISHQMALRLNTSFPDIEFDVVTFVPMTKAKIADRSFNQSALIAQWVAKENLIKCKALLQKVRETKSQHELNQTDRMQNLNDAFALTDLFEPGQTILLIDDIKTTGATLKQCETLLMQAGAKDVYCLCCAVSDYHSLDF